MGASASDGSVRSFTRSKCWVKIALLESVQKKADTTLPSLDSAQGVDSSIKK